MKQLKENKWEGVHPIVLKSKNLETRSIFISARRGRKQIDITIWPEVETQIVMTISENL